MDDFRLELARVIADAMTQQVGEESGPADWDGVFAWISQGETDMKLVADAVIEHLQSDAVVRALLPGIVAQIERDTIALLAAQSGVSGEELLDRVCGSLRHNAIRFAPHIVETMTAAIINEALAAAVAGERARRDAEIAEARYDQHIADGGY